MAQKGLGTVLSHSADDTTYANIAQVKELSGIGWETGSTEVTHLGSSHKEYQPNISGAKEISGTLWFDSADTTHATMQTLADTQSGNTFWKITTPDAKVYSCIGHVTDFELSGIEVEGFLEYSFSIQPSAKLTVA